MTKVVRTLVGKVVSDARDKTVSVLIVIEVRGEQISRIDICFIPDPETAKLSGIQPK